jgi:quercetin dioxygenase-like cupin family protein
MAQPMERKATMKIDRNGSRPSTKGAQDYFSGSVRVEPVFQVGEPMRLNAGSVTFEPGARTAWHTHPLGQTLIITAGLGWVQTEGGQIEEVRPGDVVWFPPGETLARRNAHYRDDAYCGSGIAQWQEC